MSRNLCDVSCHECPGGHEHIVLDEEPRPIKSADVPKVYWVKGEYRGLIVAHAHCVLCHALYLAWVDWPTSPHSHWHLKRKGEGQRFCDLSFRHAFNDEPAIEDCPLFHVEAVTTYVRRPMKREDHSYLSLDYGDEAYRAERRRVVERWEARRDAMVAMRRSVADDLRMAKEADRG